MSPNATTLVPSRYMSRACDWIFERGMQMIIDLDSWEIGYADGQSDRSSECPENVDSISYSSGYCEGRACRADARRKGRTAVRILHLEPTGL
jgi:hypothetical protein